MVKTDRTTDLMEVDNRARLQNQLYFSNNCVVLKNLGGFPDVDKRGIEEGAAMKVCAITPPQIGLLVLALVNNSESFIRDCTPEDIDNPLYNIYVITESWITKHLN